MRAVLLICLAAALGLAAALPLESVSALEARAAVEAEDDVAVDVAAEDAAEDELDVDVDAEDEAEVDDEDEAEDEAEDEDELEVESALEVTADSDAANPPLAPHPYAEAPVAKPLTRGWYGHGGFMGFGGAIVSDPKWMAVMAELMPSVATAIVQKSDVLGTIKGLENNPVCAAYGFDYWSKQAGANNAGSMWNQPFEWDSFFKPEATAANPLVEDMLVAHGTPLALFTEGTWKNNAYGAVERTAATELGGVTALKWRDVFVGALRRIRGSKNTGPVTWQEFGALFPGGRFRVILDVKTGIHQATPQFLAGVVKAWGERFVDVIGAGTFNYEQNKGLNALTGGKTAEVLFFHGLRDAGVPLIHQPQLFDVYENAALKGRLAGHTVLFNGGFLIAYTRLATGGAKERSYRIDTDAVNKLRAIRKEIPTMNLGIYVQEYDIDTVALSLINELINTNAATFNMGFAWGGKQASYYSAIQPSLTDATTGTNGQILFAKVTSA